MLSAMQNKTIEKIVPINLSYFTIVTITVYCFSAICGYGRESNLLASIVMAFLMLYFCVFANQKIKINMYTKVALSFIAFFLYFLISSVINITSIYYFLGTIITWTLVMFFPLFISLYLSKVVDQRKLKILFCFLSGAWFTIVILSIIVFASAEIGGRSFAQMNRGYLIGGAYPMAYGSTIIAVILSHYIFDKTNKVTGRGILLIAFLLSIVHVIMSQSVITIAAMFSGLFASFIFMGQKNNAKITSSLITVCVLLLLFTLNFKSIGLFFIEVGYDVENAIFSQRIIEMGQWMYYDTQTSHVSARTDTLVTSFFTFMNNPIIGCGYLVGNTFEYLYSVGIGNHSEILDKLAQYGLVGSFFYFSIFYHQLRLINHLSNYSIQLPLIITVFIMAMFNPFVSAQTCFVLFLYIPLSLKLDYFYK